MDADARFAAVETRLDGVDTRLDRVEFKLAHLADEVSNFKWWLMGAALTIVVTAIGTVIGTGVGIQQMTVATFQAAAGHLTPQAPPQPTIIVVPQAQPQPPASK